MRSSLVPASPVFLLAPLPVISSCRWSRRAKQPDAMAHDPHPRRRLAPWIMVLDTTMNFSNRQERHLTSTERRDHRIISGLRILPRSRMKNGPTLELGSPVPGAKGISRQLQGEPLTSPNAGLIRLRARAPPLRSVLICPANSGNQIIQLLSGAPRLLLRPEQELRDTVLCSANIERRGPIKVKYGHPMQDSPQILEKEFGSGIRTTCGD